METKVLSRRNFITRATLGATALGMGSFIGCSQATSNSSSDTTTTTPPTSSVSWDGEYDVVVVGAGGAGLAATIAACEAGASVLAVEVEVSSNFSATGLCGGVVYAIGTDIQKELDIEDSIEEALVYADAVSDGMADNDLLHYYLENSNDILVWMQDKGIVFPAENLYYSGQELTYEKVAKPAMRGHRTQSKSGADITSTLYEVASSAGAEFMFETRATGLYQDDAGRVIGIASAEGNFKAHKGVILASAGFSRNPDMCVNYNPDQVKGKSCSSSHQQGDGIIMAAGLGAKLSRMWAVQAKVLYIDIPPAGAYFAIATRGLPIIFVNEQGERIMNETRFYELPYDDIVREPNSFVWGIWDQTAINAGHSNVSIPDPSENMAIEIERGIAFKADTLEDLATQIKVDPTILAAQVTRYNEMVAAGVDTDFGRTKGLDAPISNPPYFASKIYPGVCDTAGGLATNTKAQVLNWDGDIIPGLYAAGSTTGGWRGKYYVGSGTAVGAAVFYGREAGQNAAAETV